MRSTVFLLLLSLAVVTACKKESGNDTGGNPNAANKPPIANAGPDQHISAGSFVLDGSASRDSDGQITEWYWSKISGPGNVSIVAANQKQTNVSVTLTGLFQFELLVKDNGGSSAMDTVAIWIFAPGSFCVADNRPVINSKLVPVWRFPFERFGMSATTLGTRVYFAGGRDAFSGDPTAQVVIWDLETKQEMQANLSIPRAFIGSISAGNKLFFAGGWTWAGASSRVEIVDISTGASKIAELSEPRWGVATAVLGNKVFFAGGNYFSAGSQASSRVDIYDMATDTWSTSNLSEARFDIATSVVDNKIYFAGGNKVTSVSNVIDIYDGQTNSWTASRLNTAVANPAALAVNNKIYWAGGYDISLSSGGSPQKHPRCQVEIKDINNQSSSSASLIKSVSSLVAVQRNNQIIFFPGPDSFSYFFDIYNISSGSWSVGIIPTGLREGVRFTYKNEIYVAGGYLGSYVGSDIFNQQILKLEF